MNINYIEAIGEILKNKDSHSLEYKIYKSQISKIIENDLKTKNPKELMQEYVDYFSKKNLKKIRVEKGKEFYRGRIGKMILPGGFDDKNEKFTLPYYGDDIKAAPPLYTSGGRFNRAGVSYLYLATDLETCLAEVHLQVGQECSVGKFNCLNDIELINLSDYGEDLELKVWYDIITQPVHNEIRYKYFVTQFLAEVLMNFNSNGLYFKSVQSNGDNIVCFKPENFKLVEYSEKLYEAKKIKYDYVQVEDTVREFAKRKDSHLINDLNTDLVEENEKRVEYLLEWINKEKLNENK